MEELCVPAELEQLDRVLGFIAGKLDAAGCEEQTKLQIMIAVEEIFTNIFSYAYPPKKGMATIRIGIDGKPAVAQIEMIDQGVPYDPLQQKDPDITLSAEERSIGGLGIFIVKQTMDEVSYRYENTSNILTIRKMIGR